MTDPRASKWEALNDAVTAWLPFGLAPALLLLVTGIAGVFVLVTPVKRSSARLRMWTFAANHHQSYQAALSAFVQRTGIDVDLQHVSVHAVTRKLQAAFRAGLDIPDLVEVEYTHAGTFFRGPLETIPFVDLRPYLMRTQSDRGASLYDRMVKNRFVLYSHRGHIYGLPHDVHPVMLAYRRDLIAAHRDLILAQTGLDVGDARRLGEVIETWDDFIKVARVLTVPGKRYMMQLSDSNVSSFELLLYQRGGDFFDAQGRVILQSDTAVETLLWMIPLIAGEKDERIADRAGGSRATLYPHVLEGFILAYFCPDWLAGMTEFYLAALAGKMALMPVPYVKDDPRRLRTTTGGGTMLALTRQSDRSPEQAWAVAQHIYFDIPTLKAQFQETRILPPFKGAWQGPGHPDYIGLDEPLVFWSGQPIGRMFANLADIIPTRHGNPFLPLAREKTAEVIAAAATYYRQHGRQGFEAFVRHRLQRAAAYIEFQMRRNPF